MFDELSEWDYWNCKVNKIFFTAFTVLCDSLYMEVLCVGVFSITMLKAFTMF